MSRSARSHRQRQRPIAAVAARSGSIEKPCRSAFGAAAPAPGRQNHRAQPRALNHSASTVGSYGLENSEGSVPEPVEAVMEDQRREWAVARPDLWVMTASLTVSPSDGDRHHRTLLRRRRSGAEK